MRSGALIAKKKHESEQEIYLRLLEHVAVDCEISQARFAEQVGIAKGLANAYFNRCLSKGWIKLRQTPRKRYLYYITPVGLSEKVQLTAKFLTSSYQFYRDARADLVTTMTVARDSGHRSLGVLGAGELAEIAVITSAEARVRIAGILGEPGARKKISGKAVKSSWAEICKADAALLTSVEHARKMHGDMRRDYPHVEVYVPRQLAPLL